MPSIFADYGSRGPGSGVVDGLPESNDNSVMKKSIVWILAIGMGMVAAGVFAQQPAASPSFEVASIKPAPPLTVDKIRSGQFHAGISVTGTRADFGFMSLADLLPYAYRVKPYQISGPDWMKDDRWDIVAKLPDGEVPDHAHEMLLSLLIERFKLAGHRENREHPVYELTVGKDGVKFSPSTPEDDAPVEPASGATTFPGFGTAGSGNISINRGGRGAVITGGANGTTRVTPGPNGGMQMEMTKITMAALADMLTPVLDRPVVDRTELKGTYHIALELPMDALMNMAQTMARSMNLPVGPGAFAGAGAAAAGGPGTGEPVALDPSGASMIHAVQQLGLKLESGKAPVETIVIDHLEKAPVEN
jgi:uncharacterized protein (TIGR03435 family)